MSISQSMTPPGASPLSKAWPKRSLSGEWSKFPHFSWRKSPSLLVKRGESFMFKSKSTKVFFANSEKKFPAGIAHLLWLLVKSLGTSPWKSQLSLKSAIPRSRLPGPRPVHLHLAHVSLTAFTQQDLMWITAKKTEPLWWWWCCSVQGKRWKGAVVESESPGNCNYSVTIGNYP